jgi:hypothetical protein
MRIGIDFDNTIVSYDELFYKVAREKDVVPVDTPANKVAVRDYLRKAGREEIWTEMQGYVYGARMDEAISYPGAFDFIQSAAKVGHELFIVSHKTKHPFLGMQYDLHSAARSWVAKHLNIDGVPIIATDQVFFELTKEAKLKRAGQIGCQVFLDDLPEILLSEHFPPYAQRVLFDPEGNHVGVDLPDCMIIKSWSDFDRCLTS